MTRPNPIDFSLYLISDRQALPKGRDFLTAVEEALQGGVDAVQLRDKDLPEAERLALAHQLRALTRRYRARLLINGSVDIALAAEATAFISAPLHNRSPKRGVSSARSG